MKSDDFKRFREVLAGMAKLYERELDELLLDAYWLALRDWQLAEFERAAAHLMATVEYPMPRPAHFNALRKAAQPTTGEAWARVLQHIKGAYRGGAGIDNGGPTDQAVKAIGGYRFVAHYDLAYLGVLAQRFAEHFEAAQDVGETRAALPELEAPMLRLVGRE